MIMVAIDSNAILVAPMKSKADKEQRLAYLSMLKRLKQAGVDVRKHVLDNECSDRMKELIKSECKLELAPPGCHRRNLAEWGIKLFKNHFLSIMSGVDEAFPTHLWDKLLPQAELTLNLLRQSNATPSVSAHAHLFGVFRLQQNASGTNGMQCTNPRRGKQERIMVTPHGGWMVPRHVT